MDWQDHPTGAKGEYYRLISLEFFASHSAWLVGAVGVIAGIYLGAAWGRPMIGSLVGGFVAWAVSQFLLVRLIKKHDARTDAAKNDEYSNRWSAGAECYK